VNPRATVAVARGDDAPPLFHAQKPSSTVPEAVL